VKHAGISVAFAVCILAAACSSSSPKGPAFPDTAAGKQARWLYGAAADAPIPVGQIDAHFDRALLAAVSPAMLNQTFAGLKSLTFDSIESSSPDLIEFLVTADGSEVSVRVAVDAAGLIAGLHFGPPLSTTTSTSAAPSPFRAVSLGVGSPPLKAVLTLPAGDGPFPAVVLVSGSGPNDLDETVGPDKAFLDIANGLAADGIATLRYDKRTLDYPASIGGATFTPTQEYVPDAVAAVTLLRGRPDIDPAQVFVLGHSQGGQFAPLIAKDAPGVVGVILAAAAAEPFGPDLVRQFRYLATLPGAIGTQAASQLPAAEQAAAQITPAALAGESPTTKLSPLLGGVGPAYFVNLDAYDEVATARAIPQPLLFLQGDRDYNVTVAADLDVWLRGLSGRAGVTVKQFPAADHEFIDGTGAPSPADYDTARHVDPAVIAAIAAWIKGITG
jgi:dienelactone hydrolase